MKKNSREPFIIFFKSVFASVFFCTTANAADLSTIFGEVNTTFSQVLDFVLGPLCYTACAMGAAKIIYDIIITKRSGWHELKGFCIGVVFIGFIPTIVKALLKYTG